MRGGWLLPALALAGCQPNPRNEISAIAQAALEDVVRTSPGQASCVARTIAPWRPPAEARRYDTPAPPGMAELYGAGVFRGGGGLKSASVGGLPVAGGTGCLVLSGPLVRGDHAMLEMRLETTSLNSWLKRTDGDWRVVMTTASVYRR